MELNKDVLENINEEVLKIGGDAKSDSYKYNIDVLKDILSNVETIAGSGGAGLNVVIVEELPTTGEPHTIYLVPNEGSKPNIYDEYMYIANDWEKIGSTEIDLTNYLAKNNTSEFTPTGDYNPATKKYVDDIASSAGGTTTVYTSVPSSFNITTLPVGVYLFRTGGTLYLRTSKDGSGYTSINLNNHKIVMVNIFKTFDDAKSSSIYTNTYFAYMDFFEDGNQLKRNYFYRTGDSQSASTYGDAISDYFLSTTSTVNISGKFTFNTLPESSITPSTNNQLVNKSYVDAQIQALREELSGE